MLLIAVVRRLAISSLSFEGESQPEPVCVGDQDMLMRRCSAKLDGGHHEGSAGKHGGRRVSVS
jgi:hypothetical protein